MFESLTERQRSLFLKILEHTSTQLVLQDSTLLTWLNRVFGFAFLCIIFRTVLLALIDESGPPIGWPGIVFIAIVTYFAYRQTLFPQNKIIFDKNLGKVSIVTNYPIGHKTVSFPLRDIVDVFVRQQTWNTQKRSRQTSYIVALKTINFPQTIYLFNQSFRSSINAYLAANLIRVFLNLSK